jgi:hypothetical protein
LFIILIKILLPDTSCGEGSSPSRLYDLLIEKFPDSNIISVQRKYFNDIRGLDYIKNLCIVDYSKCIIELTAKCFLLFKLILNKKKLTLIAYSTLLKILLLNIMCCFIKIH